MGVIVSGAETLGDKPRIFSQKRARRDEFGECGLGGIVKFNEKDLLRDPVFFIADTGVMCINEFTRNELVAF